MLPPDGGADMQRREFIGLVGSVAAWSSPSQAQQHSILPIASILWHGTKEKELTQPFYHWLVEGFQNAGLRPGVNVILDHEFADESDAKYNQLAPEMAAKRPDVLVAIGLPPTLALMKVHDNIPLVYFGPDPALLGVGESLARRSKAVTGVTLAGADLSGKRLQFLKTAVPSLSRVALLVNPKTRSTTENDIKQYNVAATRFDVTVQNFEIAEYGQVRAAFVHLTEWKADGVITSQSPLFALIRKEIADAALAAKLPLMAYSDTFVDQGALMSYGASMRDVFLSVGSLVRRILAGERPSEIPIMNPTKFELVVNMKTAAALGLTFPFPFLGAIDRMVE